MLDAKTDRKHQQAMELVRRERLRQLEKWGIQNHPDGTGALLAVIFADQWKQISDEQNEFGRDDWATIAAEEVMEALAETDEAKLLGEVIQSAAVFVAWAESLIGRIDNTRIKQEESSK